MSKLCAILACAVFFACSSGKQLPLVDDVTFKLTEVSDDSHYGLKEDEPVRVGGVEKGEGPKNAVRFLNALAGPGNEPITFRKSRSCCPFKSRKSAFGKAVLDIYEIRSVSGGKLGEIYIDMYHYGELKAPMGYNIKQVQNTSQATFSGR